MSGTPSRKAAPAATDAAASAIEESHEDSFEARLKEYILWLGPNATLADLKDLPEDMA
jgi:hypothetical protein